MELTEGTLGGLPLFKVEGDLDRVSTFQLHEVLRHQVALGRPRVLFDVSDCHYIDTAGLGVLFEALDELSDRAWLGLIGAGESMRDVLGTVALDRHERLILFEDEDDVLRSLAARTNGTRP